MPGGATGVDGCDDTGTHSLGNARRQLQILNSLTIGRRKSHQTDRRRCRISASGTAARFRGIKTIGNGASVNETIRLRMHNFRRLIVPFIHPHQIMDLCAYLDVDRSPRDCEIVEKSVL